MNTTTHQATPATRLGAPASSRLYALTLALALTVAMLSGVNHLAQFDRAAPQYAQASSPRA